MDMRLPGIDEIQSLKGPATSHSMLSNTAAVWEFADLLSETKTDHTKKRTAIGFNQQIDRNAGGLWSAIAESAVAEKITRRARGASGASPPKVTVGTPEYFATLRRRIVIEILPSISDLQAWADSLDFVVATRSIVEKLRDALKTLEDSKTEGNSRAILRQLRDTFLNGGWDHWRDAEKRDAGIKAARILLKEGQLAAEDVDKCFDILLEIGLSPIALPAIDFGEDSEYYVSPDVSH